MSAMRRNSDSRAMACRNAEGQNENRKNQKHVKSLVGGNQERVDTSIMRDQ